MSVHRERLAELERLLADIVSNPTVLNDEDFEETLSTVMTQVDQLWEDAREAARSGGKSFFYLCIEEVNINRSPFRKLLF